MTAVKAEAIQMMESKPKARDTTSAAFNNFVSHCKKSTITEDYKEELAESLEQRYESIH